MYNIKNIVDTIVPEIDKKTVVINDSFLSNFYENIAQDLKDYIKPVKLNDSVLHVGVNNSVIFSEIIGFRQQQIKTELLKTFEEISDIKFIKC